MCHKTSLRVYTGPQCATQLCPGTLFQYRTSCFGHYLSTVHRGVGGAVLVPSIVYSIVGCYYISAGRSVERCSISRGWSIFRISAPNRGRASQISRTDFSARGFNSLPTISVLIVLQNGFYRTTSGLRRSTRVLSTGYGPTHPL